jgi:type III restriction enzyme
LSRIWFTGDEDITAQALEPIRCQAGTTRPAFSSKPPQCDITSIINEVRGHVDTWRSLPNPNQWQVTPETGRLLQHWRHHTFGTFRPFFCQIEAAETVISLTEVAPQLDSGKRLLAHLASVNRDAKLATGAGKTTVRRCSSRTSGV